MQGILSNSQLKFIKMTSQRVINEETDASLSDSEFGDDSLSE